jgi:hypothetical protein
LRRIFIARQKGPLPGRVAAQQTPRRTARIRRQVPPSGGIQYLGGRRQLMRKPGVGTPVVTFKVRRPIELASLYDDLNIAGRESHTSVLSFMLVKAFDSTATPSASPRAAASTPSNGGATRAIYRSP